MRKNYLYPITFAALICFLSVCAWSKPAKSAGIPAAIYAPPSLVLLLNFDQNDYTQQEATQMTQLAQSLFLLAQDDFSVQQPFFFLPSQFSQDADQLDTLLRDPSILSQINVSLYVLAEINKVSGPGGVGNHRFDIFIPGQEVGTPGDYAASFEIPISLVNELGFLSP